MSIAVDLDGVVLNLIEEWLNLYNKKYEDTLKPSDILDWNTHKFVKSRCGKRIYQFIKNPKIYDNVKPIEGALEAINSLRDYGFRILFVTTFEPKFSYAKFKWLNDHGFKVDKKDYIECGDKSLILSSALIDDNYENVKNFPELGILFSSPWNLKYDYKTRVNGWQQVLDFMTKNPPGEL